MTTNNSPVDQLENSLAISGFEGQYLEGTASEAEKCQYIKDHLGSDRVIEALDELYFEAYGERMADGRTPQQTQNVNRWWNRFTVFEDKLDDWKNLIQEDQFDVRQAANQWHSLRVAYRRLQNRHDDIAPTGYSQEAQNVYDDMKDQFRRWDGTTTNRGAWWGSQRPGSTTGARNVPNSIVNELLDMTVGTMWSIEPSWTGGVSFHKTRKGIDFIYHMQSPG